MDGEVTVTLLYEIAIGSPGRRIEAACGLMVDACLFIAPELIAAAASDVARRERPT